MTNLTIELTPAQAENVLTALEHFLAYLDDDGEADEVKLEEYRDVASVFTHALGWDVSL